MNKQDLSLNELLMFQSEMRSVEKSAALAYLMLVGGHLGVHRFYLKRFKTAIMQLILFFLAAVGYVVMVFGSTVESEAWTILGVIAFGLPALALFIWIIVDLCIINRMVREYNQALEEQIITDIVNHRRQV